MYMRYKDSVKLLFLKKKCVVKSSDEPVYAGSEI